MQRNELIEKLLVKLFLFWCAAAAMFSFGLPLSGWSQTGLWLMLCVLGIVVVGS